MIANDSETVERLAHGIPMRVQKAYQGLKGMMTVTNKWDAFQHLLFGRILGKSRNKKIVYTMKNGLIFQECNSKRDRTLFITLQELFVDETYKIPIDENIPKGNLVILDLGANIGAYSLYCCVNYRVSRVLAFEPDPETFEKLNNNVRLNGLDDKIHTFKKAVNANGGSILFNVDAVSSRGSSALRRGRNRITVDATTLACIFADNNIEYCDIVKIDIEGSEYDVMFNCPKDLLAKFGFILIECHRDFVSLNTAYTKETMRAFFEENGFDILRDEDLILVAKNKSYKK
jgi:FkbM family methyltransferase